LSKSSEDTLKVKLLNQLSLECYKKGEYENAFEYAKKALLTSKKTKNKKAAAIATVSIGNYYIDQSNFTKAIELYSESLAIYESIGDKEGIAGALFALGNVALNLSDNSKAIEYYSKSLVLYESINHKNGVYKVLNQLGNIFTSEGDYPKALDMYFKSLQIVERLNEKNDIASLYSNIGIIYVKQKEYEKALTYYLKNLNLNKISGNSQGLAIQYNNLGELYKDKKDYPKALETYFKGLKISESIGFIQIIPYFLSNIGDVYALYYETKNRADVLYFENGIEKMSISTSVILDSSLAIQKRAYLIDKKFGDNYHSTASLFGIAKVFFLKKKYIESIEYFKKSYAIADTLKAINEKRQSALGLYESFKKLNKFEMGLYWYEKYIEHRDTIYNEEKANVITSNEFRFAYEKKAATDSIKSSEEKKVIFAELKQEETKRYGLYGGLFFMIIFAGFVARSLRLTRKQKNIIEIKSKETEKQKEIIEEKQKEILDSIYYAKRIQQSLLPTEKYVSKSLKRLMKNGDV
jgi:tetratricopeptide (TPR) repeat protein